MEKDKLMFPLKAHSLIKTVSIVLIIREIITILYLYAVQENLSYGIQNQKPPDFDFGIAIFMGAAILAFAIASLVEKQAHFLLLLTVAFIIELVYQLCTKFFESFYFITTPFILVCLFILWFKFLKRKS